MKRLCLAIALLSLWISAGAQITHTGASNYQLNQKVDITEYTTDTSFYHRLIITYTTAIPLNRQLTIIIGKTLVTSDAFTIVASPIEGAGAQLILIGDGTNSPDFTACDYIVGGYDPSAGVANMLTFNYVDGKIWVSIIQGIAI
jgi:hypothetical protein